MNTNGREVLPRGDVTSRFIRRCQLKTCRERVGPQRPRPITAFTSDAEAGGSA